MRGGRVHVCETSDPRGDLPLRSPPTRGRDRVLTNKQYCGHPERKYRYVKMLYGSERSFAIRAMISSTCVSFL
jgi:hypothetical protein